MFSKSKKSIEDIRQKNSEYLSDPAYKSWRPEMNIEGQRLIQYAEGLSLVPYVCPSNVVTIGYGTTRDDEGRLFTLDHVPITKDQAEQLFKRDLRVFATRVKSMLKVPVTDNQFSAVVSLAYNIGTGNLRASTLLRKLNRGDYQGCSEEFWKWRRGGGVILNGLVKRREMERRLFIT